MPAAIAVPAIIGAASTGAGLVGAKMSSNAAKNAAATQAASADRAAQLQAQATKDTLGFQRDVWNQAQQNATPYLGIGNAGVTKLSSMMGFAPQAPAQAAPLTPPTPQAVPRTSLRNLGGGGTVMMRAPDGSTQAVPQEHVAHYQSRGAQIVQ